MWRAMHQFCESLQYCVKVRFCWPKLLMTKMQINSSHIYAKIFVILPQHNHCHYVTIDLHVLLMYCLIVICWKLWDYTMSCILQVMCGIRVSGMDRVYPSDDSTGSLGSCSDSKQNGLPQQTNMEVWCIHQDRILCADHRNLWHFVR